MENKQPTLMRGDLFLRGLTWLHWVVLLLSIALTLFAYFFSKRQVEEKYRNQFNYQSEQIIGLLKDRMEKYEEGLLGGVGAIQVSDGYVTHEQWVTFYNTLSLDVKYPGVNGIGVILHVPKAEKERHLQEQRETRPSYDIHPPHPGDDLYPIVYIEPAADNLAAVGLDMAFEEGRFTALKTARDTGTVQITAPISLVQDEEQTPGFLFFSPYYRSLSTESLEERREEFLGVVYAPFIVQRLMDGLLAKESRKIGVRISDGETIIFDEHNPEEPDFDPQPLFTQEVDLPLYGRVWSLDLRSAQSFRAISQATQPVTVLLVGLCIDFMILAAFLLLSRVNKNLAEEIEERRQVEERLRKVRAELEVRVAQRTADLERSNQDLQSFVYAASHDLRTPLRGIDNLSQWLLEDYGPQLGEEGREHFELLRGRILRMESLLNALLAYNKIGRSASQIKKTDVSSLLREIIHDLALPSGFEVELPEENFIVSTTRAELSLVVQNLIQNAVKHHDKDNGCIWIKTKVIENLLHIEVGDDGPGIPSDFLDKAFQVFQKLERRDKREGSGIGLALVKKQVEFVGGELRVESQGRGTIMYFTWPIFDED